MEKILTVRPLHAMTPDAATAFADVYARYDTSGGLVALPDLLEHASVHEVLEDGDPVAWFAVRGYAHREAHEVELLIAAGRASVDLSRSVLPFIESCVRPADALTIYTRRPGLVRKLLKQGYRVDATVLRKTLRSIQ